MTLSLSLFCFSNFLGRKDLKVHATFNRKILKLLPKEYKVHKCKGTGRNIPPFDAYQKKTPLACNVTLMTIPKSESVDFYYNHGLTAGFVSTFIILLYNYIS